jgi:hypothetical protein
MPAMRVSLVARFVSHPAIDFGARRPSPTRARLGLARPTVRYHRPRRGAPGAASLAALRAQTGRFRYASVARAARARVTRVPLPLGQARRRS